jgi:hypothetical protein
MPALHLHTLSHSHLYLYRAADAALFGASGEYNAEQIVTPVFVQREVCQCATWLTSRTADVE